MIYADTDFFLALIKDKDWLKSRARDCLQRYRGKLWTSVVTAVELALLSERFALDPERIMMDVSLIAEPSGITGKQMILAAHYMKEYKLTTFDAFHAALCGTDQMLSSDNAYDRIGMKRIPLEGE